MAPATRGGALTGGDRERDAATTSGTTTSGSAASATPTAASLTAWG